MTKLYTMQEAADILGVSYFDVWNYVRYGTLDGVATGGYRGRCYEYLISESDLHRFAYRYRDRLPNCKLQFDRPKVIKIEMILEVPDEYYDEGYQRICNRARDMYEHQRIDDLY